MLDFFAFFILFSQELHVLFDFFIASDLTPHNLPFHLPRLLFLCDVDFTKPFLVVDPLYGHQLFFDSLRMCLTALLQLLRLHHVLQQAIFLYLLGFL